MNVLHADNHLLVVAKPAGVPCVPDESGDPSLLEQAREWVRVEFEKPGRAFLGVVHRLDRPVSGVVVFARTSKAAARLTDGFRERRVHKVYWAVVDGALPAASGELRQWLRKDHDRNRVHAHDRPVDGAREASTAWRVLATGSGKTLVELVPHTGRSHQLRVALASLGRPILGDLRYGAHEPLPDRSLALHALRLELDHPTREVRYAFELPPPPAFPWSPGFGERPTGTGSATAREAPGP